MATPTRNETPSSFNVPFTDAVAAACKYSVLAAVLRKFVSAAMLRCLGATYRGLPESRRSRADLFALSTVNCLLCVVNALRILITRRRLPISERKRWECEAVARLGKVEIGYFLHDLVAIAPSWRLHVSDVFHHILSLSTMSITLTQLDSLHSFVAPLLLVDASTIVLNIMWFQRELNVGASHAKKLELLFAVMFFCLRIIWLPMYLWETRTAEPEKFHALGKVGESALGGVVVLQYYWFSLIVKKLFCRA
jgi:hypothetical protein